MRKEKKRKTESWLHKEIPTKSTYTFDPRIPLKPQGQCVPISLPHGDGL